MLADTACQVKPDFASLGTTGAAPHLFTELPTRRLETARAHLWCELWPDVAARAFLRA